MTDQNRYLEEFINKIDVVCPNCEARALVVSDNLNRTNIRFTCSSCGKSMKWSGQSGYYQTSGPDMQISRAIVLGQPFDCYFKLPLWFTVEIKGKIFFAYNTEHLTFQKNYIEDPLRKRSQNEFGWSNSSLQSRLPKWMLSSKNRDELLKKISVLQNK